MAALDWDDDGRPDLLLRNRTGPRVQLFHNRYAAPGRHLSLELVGNGTSVNRDAIGARVVVDTGRRRVTRRLHAGEGFLAQSSKRLLFGLGDAERIERVEVAWPDGTRSETGALELDRRYRIHQQPAAGEAAVVAVERTAHPALAALPHAPCAGLGRPAGRVVLAYELPVGELPLPAYDAPDRRVRDLAGTPLLVTLWSRECSACMSEFIELRRERTAFDELGVRLVTLDADGPEDARAARALLSRYDLDLPQAGYVDARLHELLWEVLHPHLFGPRTNLEVVTPTSLLIDPDGNLVALYLGRTAAQHVADDVRALLAATDRPLSDRLARGFRTVHHERDFGGLASALEDRGYAALAAFYRAVAERKQSFLYRDGERREF